MVHLASRRFEQAAREEKEAENEFFEVAGGILYGIVN